MHSIYVLLAPMQHNKKWYVQAMEHIKSWAAIHVIRNGEDIQMWVMQ